MWRRNQRAPFKRGAGVWLYSLLANIFQFLSCLFFSLSFTRILLYPLLRVIAFFLLLLFCLVQAQTTLKVYSMNSERLQRNLETAEEENTVLQESNNQVRFCTLRKGFHTWICICLLLLISSASLFSISVHVFLSQLKQEVEGWAERVSELEEEMQRCEVAHSAMLQDVAIKDDRIMVWLLLMNVDHIRRTAKFTYRHMLAARRV